MTSPSCHETLSAAARRRQAFATGSPVRLLEAAIDPDGLSTTAHAVLARIQQA